MENTNLKMTNYRWVVCAMLFFATAINYLDRQVLSLTWKDFIADDFHWTNTDYGTITMCFSGFYALSMLFAGRFVDKLDTRKGFLWAIGVWSLGACLHALCGVGTQLWTGIPISEMAGAKEAGAVGLIVSASVTLFVFARLVLALGEAGNFPAAIKATAEYFPKRSRAFATSVFNSGAQIGAMVAPLSIPLIAANMGWEMSFILIGALGFLWMGLWVFVYKKPEANRRVNSAELDYILSDNEPEKKEATPKLGLGQCLRYRQTWAFMAGKFMTDGVWWFFLFWMPAYLSSVYGMPSNDPKAQLAIFVLYSITMLSLLGGWLPTYFVSRKGMDPYAGRMRAMLIFAFFPLLALLAQPLGATSYWLPVVIIGIACAAHQSWSANIYSTVSDMFPKSAVATVTGIGSMAGGLASMLINYGSGRLFDHSERTGMKLMGFEGIESGYMIIFSICAVSYLAGWVVIKMLVPRYKVITP